MAPITIGEPCPRHPDQRCLVLTLKDIPRVRDKLASNRERRWTALGPTKQKLLLTRMNKFSLVRVDSIRLPGQVEPLDRDGPPQILPRTPTKVAPSFGVGPVGPPQLVPSFKTKGPFGDQGSGCPYCKTADNVIGTNYDFMKLLDAYVKLHSQPGYPLQEIAEKLQQTLKDNHYTELHIDRPPAISAYSAAAWGIKRSATGSPVLQADIVADARTEGLWLKLIHSHEADPAAMKELLGDFADSASDFVVSVLETVPP